MKIHIITHQYSDHQINGLVEGWLLSGADKRNEFKVATGVTYFDAAPDFWETLPAADAIILCVESGLEGVNLRRAIEALDAGKLWGRTVLLDDHDSGVRWSFEPLVPKVGKAFISRRYLYERLAQTYPNVAWLPAYGVEQRVLRYAPALPWAYWKDIPAVALYRTTLAGRDWRAEWLARTKSLIPTAEAGLLDARDGSTTLQQRVFGPRHSPLYYETVSRGRVGVYLYGGNTHIGYQFWTFGALRCAILAMHPSMHPVQPMEKGEWEYLEPKLVQGEDIEVFGSAEEFDAKLKAMVADPARCERMADAVYEKLKPHHSAARAAAFLKELTDANGARVDRSA